MKNILTITALLFYSLSFSQIVSRSDAWSGIITDNSGNPLENTNIILKFTYTNNGTTILYSEQHNTTTDSNGFVTANIGQGTILQNGSSLRYTRSNLKLKVEVDTGSGFVTLSDDYPKAVPFANAATYAGELTDGFSTIFFNTANYQVNIDANQEIILGVNGEVQGEINENGLKLNDLAGTGIREVVTDPNGQLQRKPVQTKYLSISGAAFVGNGLYQVLHLSNTSGGVLTNVYNPYPLILPHGATITNFKVTFYDNSTRNFELGIVEIDNNSGATAFSFITVFDSNNYPTFASNQVQNIPITKTIDNLNKSYTLALVSDEWPLQSGSFDLRFLSVVITYQE